MYGRWRGWGRVGKTSRIRDWTGHEQNGDGVTVVMVGTKTIASDACDTLC